MALRCEDKLEVVRVVTRAIGFLLPLTTLCVALFVVEEVKDIVVGFISGAASMAGVFYFNSEQEKTKL